MAARAVGVGPAQPLTGHRLKDRRMPRVAFVRRGMYSSLTLLVLAASQVGAATKIDPTADRVLRRMCRYLQSQRQFHFAASEQFDMVRDSGQKVKYSNYREVTVRRPNRIYSDISGDTMN